MTNKTNATDTQIPAPCQLLEGVGPTESELSFNNLSRDLGKKLMINLQVHKPNLMTKKHKYVTARP